MKKITLLLSCCLISILSFAQDDEMVIPTLKIKEEIILFDSGLPAKGTLTVLPQKWDSEKKQESISSYEIVSMLLQINGGDPIEIKNSVITLDTYTLKTKDMITVSNVQLRKIGTNTIVLGKMMSFMIHIK